MSGTEISACSISWAYHPDAFFTTRTCLTTNPSGIGRCRVIGTAPIEGALYLTTRDWIRFELRKHERAVLPLLLATRTSIPTLLHKLECFVQPFQSILQYLRLYVLEFKNFLLCSAQSILLFVVVWVGRIRRNYVFPVDVASVDRTFTRRFAGGSTPPATLRANSSSLYALPVRSYRHLYTIPSKQAFALLE